MSDETNEMFEICKLVVSAAAKQTIAAHRLRDQFDGEPDAKEIIDKAAVGRLHNAARRARAILPADVVAEVEAAAGLD